MRNRTYYLALTLALGAMMLAGCDRTLTDQSAGQAESSPAPQSTAAIAPQTPAVAVVTPLALAPTAPLPADMEQTLQNLEQVARVRAAVFERAAPAVVRVLTGQGLGSGFLIDDEGHIVTNNHVVASGGGGQLRIAFNGLFEAVGEVVGTDPDSDIAVVKVDKLPEGVEPLALGDSSALHVGQEVIAIGNPFGQERTVTDGIVSALGRTISEETSQYSIGGAIQTDASINPGNSGGPLLDLRGRVIGMNTAGLSPSGTSSGIGFAVPANLIAKVAPDLIAQGSYNHPWLGVQIGGEVTTLVAEQQNLPATGLLVRPDPDAADSPLRQAGLEGQAVLTAVDGEPATSADQLISFLELNKRPGDTVGLTVVELDGGQQRELEVTLGSRPNVEGR